MQVAHEHQQEADLLNLVERQFGTESDVSYMTLSAIEATQELGNEAVEALDYGLRIHLEAIAAGRETAAPGQLLNFLSYFGSREVEHSALSVREVASQSTVKHLGATARGAHLELLG